LRQLFDIKTADRKTKEKFTENLKLFLKMS